MGSSDTSLVRGFPTTRWSAVFAAGESSDRAALDRLCRTYWKPVYTFILLVWRAREEDARDLAQGFFVRLLEQNPWSRLRPECGSFRRYVKRALRNFLISAQDRVGVIPPPMATDPPERAFDREWFRILLDEAMAETTQRLEREHKPLYAEAFRMYAIDSEGTYREVADRLGIRESDVRNHLTHVRRLLREALRRKIRAYVASDGEVEEELKEAMA